MACRDLFRGILRKSKRGLRGGATECHRCFFLKTAVFLKEANYEKETKARDGESL